ncbi:MAG TPA: GNAT family N-acetyltransferase, partial [Ktedonobacterales bacterium]|nr:GNAT family N-acetyltransferase [Ktedonobacterales bacterium]
FAWVDGSGEATLQLHPRLRVSPQGDTLLDAMLMWVNERVSVAGVTRCEIPALADDTLYDAALTRHGFARAQPTSLVFQQQLDAPLSAPTLPDGWQVRHVADEADSAQRVELHRAVWYPSRVTVESYRRLRSAPLYRPAIDLVAVSPKGAFAAYCICWYDPANQTGEFEPVGTHPEFRGQGLGKAVVREGLRRLQALGARLASVSTGVTDYPPKFSAAAAHRLYSAAGFAVVNTWWAYRNG